MERISKYQLRRHICDSTCIIKPGFCFDFKPKLRSKPKSKCKKDRSKLCTCFKGVILSESRCIFCVERVIKKYTFDGKFICPRCKNDCYNKCSKLYHKHNTIIICDKCAGNASHKKSKKRIKELENEHTEYCDEKIDYFILIDEEKVFRDYRIDYSEKDDVAEDEDFKIINIEEYKHDLSESTDHYELFKKYEKFCNNLKYGFRLVVSIDNEKFTVDNYYEINVIRDIIKITKKISNFMNLCRIPLPNENIENIKITKNMRRIIRKFKVEVENMSDIEILTYFKKLPGRFVMKILSYLPEYKKFPITELRFY